jgi:hypothetical protein
MYNKFTKKRTNSSQIEAPTGHGEDADTTMLPNFVLLQQERQQYQHASVVNDPPDVNRSRQTSRLVGKVVDASRNK